MTNKIIKKVKDILNTILLIPRAICIGAILGHLRASLFTALIGRWKNE